MEISRQDDLALAIRLSLATIAWNVASGTAALVAAFGLGSISLAGLGFNAVLDSVASAVLVWRFTVETREPHRAERIEHVARLFVGWTLVSVAIYLAEEAVRDLVTGRHAETSTASLVIAAAAVAVLTPLAMAKRRVANRLGSRALHADSMLSAMGAALAVVTLVAGALSASVGWTSADAIAGLIIAGLLVREGIGSLREES
jgi:divalent metal cation (Fe/Co/Zn/Cd) transporter